MSPEVTPPGPRLQVSGVVVRAEGVTVLDRVSATVKAGERVGLIGPSGAGKTVLLDVVTRLCPVAAGSIWYDGHDLLRLRPDRIPRLGIGRTFQDPRPFPGATVRAAIELAAAAAEGIAVGSVFVRRAKRRARFADAAEVALQRAGLEERADRPQGALPRPGRAYLEIARALVAEPRLLLLDRPAVGVAAAEREAFAAFLQRMSDEGVAVVLAEHDVALVAELCPRVIVLHRGRRLSDGPTEAVGADPEVWRAFAGPAP
jgi:branched-chain amino acid transport system ATP-binding protein